MFKRKFANHIRLVCSPVKQLNSALKFNPKSTLNLWIKKSAKTGRLLFPIKKSLSQLVSNQIQSSKPYAKQIRAILALLVLTLFLIISPNMAVKAVREEKVLADQSQKTVLLSAEIVAAKIPEFLAPTKGSISTWFSSFHPGIDIPNPITTEVKAADSGQVTFAGWTSSGHGNLIIIRHTLGFETYYAHLSTIRAVLGQKVEIGEVIGNVGSTGNSTGSHLHFEIHQNSGAINPLRFISP